MIILKTLWDIIVAVFYSILVLYILYGICEFFDWVEYKRFERDMNRELKRKHERENRDHAQDIRMQNIMREWNW